jgi:hypothetical protein
MKHTLQENMRRFGTKNLSEQTTQTNLTSDELAVLGLCAEAAMAKTDVKNSTSAELMAGMVQDAKVGKLAKDLFNKKQSGTGTYDKNMFQIMLNVLKRIYPNQSDVDKLIKYGTNVTDFSMI